jgi:hypothetical protein
VIARAAHVRGGRRSQPDRMLTNAAADKADKSASRRAITTLVVHQRPSGCFAEYSNYKRAEGRVFPATIGKMHRHCYAAHGGISLSGFTTFMLRFLHVV